MRLNPKFYISCLIVLLFLFVLTIAPGETSANGPKERGERSTTEKRDKDAHEKTADSVSARERLNRPVPVNATPSAPSSKRGALSQAARFIKNLFVSSDRKAASLEPAEGEEDGNDPDLPTKRFLGKIDKQEYLRLRDEHINRLRGVEPGMPFDASIRGRAIVRMQQQETELQKAAKSKGRMTPLAFPFWTSIGPRPVPNGSSQPGTLGPVTGRVTAIATDPTNSSIVYLGTAQGGVWRTTNGGTTWVAIFDNAQSLGIGAIALAPSNHDILYIGTGEANLCADCFAGVGLYRIDNASTTTGALADLKGPINPAFTYTSSATLLPVNTTVFGGRAISRIAVHPTIPGTIFVGTSTGVVGDNGASPVTNGSLVGLYRSTNADVAPASVAFEKLPVITLASASADTPATGNRRISDLILEPGNSNNLLVSTFGANVAGDGGIFRTTNALAAPGSTVAFTNTFTISANRLQFGINKTGAVITVLAAINEPSAAPCPASQAGRVHRSVDGGVTWPLTLNPVAGAGGILTGADGFCGGQCFYNVDVEIDPNDVNTVFLAGNARGTCQDAIKKSGDGGQTWARDDTAVHADSHVFAFDTLSSPSVVYTGNDGGVWKRTANLAAASPWTNLNNSPLDTIQFESVAIHPTDANFTIGGTQDNGTEAQDTPPAGPSVSGTWINAEGGDGGYALIDQSSDATNITMYHTFFNQQNNLIGFDRANLRSCLGVHDGWESRGFGFGTDATPSCDGTAFAAANGITNDAVLFYAPMALGPNPGTSDIHNGTNTLYFGTDRLYRSINKGDTMTVVSQAPIVSGQPISTIGVSPQDDTYRMVGLTNGTVWGTSTGSSTLINLTSGSFPASLPGGTKFTGRVYFDPLNKNVAYVTFAYYATAGQNVWKISNFTAAAVPAGPAPAWTAVGTGIPSIPVNAFVIDPGNSSRLFAGTDIGVYASFDGGVNWSPFGQGLPKVSVFSMDIQPTARILRVATHGRGMWEINLIGPTAAAAMISGQVTTTEGAPLAGVSVKLSGAKAATAITDSNGSYRFEN
ncbi:MAG TPA: carboxypeptidase-like regulatory domain-containing protein, partial [Pyrinomonadaceae bacterium]|nr:carboxypeptidase-like regulatory domain-containing protein [Pyrinomonadaceae bacterium]